MPIEKYIVDYPEFYVSLSHIVLIPEQQKIKIEWNHLNVRSYIVFKNNKYSQENVKRNEFQFYSITKYLLFLEYHYDYNSYYIYHIINRLKWSKMKHGNSFWFVSSKQWNKNQIGVRNTFMYLPPQLHFFLLADWPL